MRRIPKLCRRKDGRFYSTDPRTKKPVYFGDDPAKAERAYARWGQEFLSEIAATGRPLNRHRLTIDQLINAYLDHAEAYYRKHGKKTSESGTIKAALAAVSSLYGETSAAEFGPLALKAVRQSLVDADHARQHVNKQISRVRRMFRWAVANELLKADQLTALETVPDLTKGRTTAREEEPVKPVAWSTVEATLPHLKSDRQRALVRVHYFGAMRAEDAVQIRPVDIDRSGPVWIYRPVVHKTEHLGLDRAVYLGPQAQAVLAPLIDAALTPDSWLFPSRNRPRHHFTVNGYRQAIAKAVKRANEKRKRGAPPITHWFPLQIRHAALTAIRAKFGLEAAQQMAGHARADVTEIYAERDRQLALRVAGEIG